ncbi:sensor histidine kinase [Pseudorhodobacter wandonensis]|jgi:signal transduction histidine kinase|uniref:sensor histidine kinase n=1 Tax=Pseudorhodobacter wandonensis TaxID=1120568 RepID=UPI00067B5676|nr:HAMP domain-containing sensor histidine kinase [Pseudorhodobacter wandonensis]
MQNLSTLWATRGDWFTSYGREQSIKDYILLTNQLLWKRQGSFFVSAILAALYFDPISIFACYVFVILTEVLDELLGSKSKTWDGRDPVVGRQILKRIALNTVASGLAISVFIINIAVQQEASAGHFTPLFFLFSASVFAAMYNSQMMGILILRLSIYGFAFLYISLLDVFRYRPPLSSHIWLEFFTIIFVLYFISDISLKFYLGYQERREQMNLIQEENEHTKDALEVKSRFLATVSHELRTPLTSIIGSLELINNDKLGLLPLGLKPLISIATRNGKRLAVLIEDLLDMQKLEAGEVVFHLKPINANDLVYEAIKATSGYASKLGIYVTTEPCEEACQITGDHNRLIQVMANLLSNALKFSYEGGTVKVRVENLGGRIRISVQDEGLGIPNGAKDCVFGKFSQVDSSDVRKAGGTGLGLNISKQIVERHNATIDYVSALGVGSTFFIEFDQLTNESRPSANLEPLVKSA